MRIHKGFGFAALAAALAVSSPVAAETPAAGEQPAEKLICKKFTEIGSLVKKRKQCMTQAEWDRVSASQREGSRRMVEELSTRYQCASATTC